MRDVETLLEALPYIRDFHGKTVVIKYGGAAMTEPLLKEEFARDVVLLKYVGMNPVIVHGGGPEITSYMNRLDLTVEFVDGLRVSDQATVEVAKMVLIGKVNKDIVLRLGRHGQRAVGLSGADRSCVSHNINADEAAGAVAGALGAYKLMFLTDVEGWLRDPDDPGSIVSQASAAEVAEALPSVSGGMRPKLQACVDAIAAGVTFSHIVDGRLPHSLLLELFTDAGIGTKIR